MLFKNEDLPSIFQLIEQSNLKIFGCLKNSRKLTPFLRGLVRTIEGSRLNS